MAGAPWASKPWGVDIAKAFAQGVTEYNKDPDTADEEAFQRSRGKTRTQGAAAAYTELLTFAEFDPAEHPRGKGGKFAKAAVGDIVEYALHGVSGQEKHTGTVVHADENGVAVKGASGEVRQFEHKDVTVLTPKGSALGDTRIPTADELVDADKSELSRWMLSDVGHTRSQLAKIDTLESAVAGVKGYKYEHSPEMDAHVAKILADTQAELDTAKTERIEMPSDSDQGPREDYKAAIAEHLGGVLAEEAGRNGGLQKELVETTTYGKDSRPLPPEDKEWFSKQDPVQMLKDYKRGLITLRELHSSRVSDEALKQVGYPTRPGPNEKVGEEKSKEIASDFIHTWAETSADTHPGALAIQEMVAQEFGVPMADHLKDALNTNRAEINRVIDTQGETIKTLVRAQYAWTQQELAAAGVKEVTLYRGMEQLPQTTTTGLDDRVSLQPLSSFSVEYNTALSFANKDAEGNALTVMRVPRERVFSTAKTGFGCLNEGEVVVLGGPNLPALTTWAHATQGIGGAMHELPALNLQRTFVGALQKEPDIIGKLTGRQQHAEQQVDPQQGAALDADLANADWTKSVWDLPYNTVKDLRAYLDRQGMTVEAFKTLPVYTRNVGRGDFAWLRQL